MSITLQRGLLVYVGGAVRPSRTSFVAVNGASPCPRAQMAIRCTCQRHESAVAYAVGGVARAIRAPHHGPSRLASTGVDEEWQPKVRAAVPDDAPAMGRVMVEAWLTAHRGQVPDAAWHKRVNEWTPEVSAQAWARNFAERAQGHHPRDVLLVAEDDADDLIAVVFGMEADDDSSGSVAEVAVLYVLPDRQRQGIGRLLLMEAGKELTTLGFTRLHISVLTANLPARSFYEAMGGQEIGQRTIDEEGYLLPGTVYGWTDIAALASDVRQSS